MCPGSANHGDRRDGVPGGLPAGDPSDADPDRVRVDHVRYLDAIGVPRRVRSGCSLVHAGPRCALRHRWSGSGTPLPRQPCQVNATPHAGSCRPRTTPGHTSAVTLAAGSSTGNTAGLTRKPNRQCPEPTSPRSPTTCATTPSGRRTAAPVTTAHGGTSCRVDGIPEVSANLRIQTNMLGSASWPVGGVARWAHVDENRSLAEI